MGTFTAVCDAGHISSLESQNVILLVKAGLAYFAIVFSAGFMLGMVRVPFLVPHFGQRISELIELPFMLAAIFIAARWIVRLFDLRRRPLLALSIGTFAAVLLILVEFSVILCVRGLTLSEFLATRDPIAAAFYYVAVAIFAGMPAIMSSAIGRSD